MAVRAVLLGFSLILSIIGSNASDGQWTILHSPESLRFYPSLKVKESFIKEIYSASLGLSVREENWTGLGINDPFDTPRRVLEVYIDGVNSLGTDTNYKPTIFHLKTDEYEPDTFDAMKYRIQQRFPSENKIVNLDLSDNKKVSEVFGVETYPKEEHSLKHLNYDVKEHQQFLNEIDNLNRITEEVRSRDVSADNAFAFYSFKFRSLHPLVDFYGPNSPATKEALQMLRQALLNMNDAFVRHYDGSILVTVMTSDVAHTRRVVRAAPEGAKDDTLSDVHNDGYSADYAAIFNIILWFGVVLSFTLVAIVYTLMDMDPGRDSIIYRMTSTRMKKDN